MPSGVIPIPHASLEKSETGNRENTAPLLHSHGDNPFKRDLICLQFKGQAHTW